MISKKHVVDDDPAYDTGALTAADAKVMIDTLLE
jgi:hypothetical protein